MALSLSGSSSGIFINASDDSISNLIVGKPLVLIAMMKVDTLTTGASIWSKAQSSESGSARRYRFHLVNDGRVKLKARWFDGVTANADANASTTRGDVFRDTPDQYQLVCAVIDRNGPSGVSYVVNGYKHYGAENSFTITEAGDYIDSTQDLALGALYDGGVYSNSLDGSFQWAAWLHRDLTADEWMQLLGGTLPHELDNLTDVNLVLDFRSSTLGGSIANLDDAVVRCSAGTCTLSSAGATLVDEDGELNLLPSDAPLYTPNLIDPAEYDPGYEAPAFEFDFSPHQSYSKVDDGTYGIAPNLASVSAQEPAVPRVVPDPNIVLDGDNPSCRIEGWSTDFAGLEQFIFEWTLTTPLDMRTGVPVIRFYTPKDNMLTKIRMRVFRDGEGGGVTRDIYAKGENNLPAGWHEMNAAAGGTGFNLDGGSTVDTILESVDRVRVEIAFTSSEISADNSQTFPLQTSPTNLGEELDVPVIGEDWMVLESLKFYTPSSYNPSLFIWIDDNNVQSNPDSDEWASVQEMVDAILDEGIPVNLGIIAKESDETGGIGSADNIYTWSQLMDLQDAGSVICNHMQAYTGITGWLQNDDQDDWRTAASIADDLGNAEMVLRDNGVGAYANVWVTPGGAGGPNDLDLIYDSDASSATGFGGVQMIRYTSNKGPKGVSNGWVGFATIPDSIDAYALVTEIGADQNETDSNIQDLVTEMEDRRVSRHVYIHPFNPKRPLETLLDVASSRDVVGAINVTTVPDYYGFPVAIPSASSRRRRLIMASGAGALIKQRRF